MPAAAAKYRLRWLAGLGTFSAIGYLLLSWMSWPLVVDTPGDDTEVPTLWMLLILGLEFCCYWVALAIAVRTPVSRRLLIGIIGGACLFRAILLPSIPIHEIDIYRYVWDGAVVADGGNPYRYAPQQVRDAINRPLDSLDTDLRRLVELQSRSDSLASSLARIHYGKLPSPYPAVSQAVFAISALVTPGTASEHSRMVTMKLLLVLFDVATMLVVLGLIVEVGLHPGWCLAYAWCPLLLKEIANGGHLDSIAIFLTTLAIWLLVKSCRAFEQKSFAANVSSTVLVGGILGLAIGAKLYPVVLLPLFAALWWRRCGGPTLVVGVLMSAIVSLTALSPLLSSAQSPSRIAERKVSNLAVPLQHEANHDASHDASYDEPLDPSAGLREFLNRWEMNDLIFMVVLENMRIQAGVLPHAKPWFVVIPDRWKREGKGSTFLMARLLTGGGFLLFACWLAWRSAGCGDPQVWCRAAMLTLAWFWLTCPTQNPWYWCWVVPLLPFARYRIWHIMAACSMLYYLRFWLIAHYPEPPVLGTAYSGEFFFYFVIPWVEFAPCLAVLAMEWRLYVSQNRAPRPS